MSPRARWRGVLALAVAETTSWGILYYSFSVFLGFFERDLGTSKAAASGAFSVAILAAAAVAGAVGRGVDRWGTRPIMTAGSVVAAAAFALLAGATSLWQVYLLLLFVGVSQAAVLYESAFAAVARWFPTPAPRTRALLVVTSCAGFASTVFVPLTAFLCEHHGWRAAILILAAALAVVTIPLHATLPHEAPAQQPRVAASGPPAARGLAVVSALQSFVSAGVAVHLVSYLHASGHGLAQAAAIAGVLGGAQVPGRVLFAPFARWAGSRWRLPMLLTVQGVALVGIVTLHGAALIAVVAFFGAANGMLTLERATLVAERFGAHEYGAVSGRIAALSLVGRAVAPFAVGLLAGATSSYAPAFLALAGVLAMTAMRLAPALIIRHKSSDGTTAEGAELAEESSLGA